MGLLKHREFRHLEPRKVFKWVTSNDFPRNSYFKEPKSVFINNLIWTFGINCQVCNLKIGNERPTNWRPRMSGQRSKKPWNYSFSNYALDDRVNWWDCVCSLCQKCRNSLSLYLRTNDFDVNKDRLNTKKGWDKLILLSTCWLSRKVSRMKLGEAE